MFQRYSRRRHLQTGGSRGQVLVEFALVIIAFMTIFMGLIEFGIAFSVQMQVSWASRDAVIMAAESGNAPVSVDCSILNRIDQDLITPATRSNVTEVDIFWATASGGVNSGAIETYTPGGTLCLGWGGWSNTVNNYPGSSRCAFINSTGGTTSAGCQTGHNGPDEIGVKIVYKYTWFTPLPTLIPLSGTGFTLTQMNLTTMEPIPVT